MAGWNPFDPIKSAPFFDVETMFGFKNDFDVVLGNPPFGAKFSKEEKAYFKEKYKHQNYQPESFLLFTEKSFSFLKNEGVLSFIIPNTWLTNIRLIKIRKFLTSQNAIRSISHYHKNVFDATVDTEVVLFQKGFKSNNYVRINRHIDSENIIHLIHNQEKWKSKEGGVINIFVNEKTEEIIVQIENNSYQLKGFADIYSGVKPYEVGKGNPPQTRKMLKERVYDSTYQIDDSYKKFVRGKDIIKYRNVWDGTRWIKYGPNLAAMRNPAIFFKPKIIIRQTGDCLIATFDSQQFICQNNTHVVNQKNNIDLKYLLALINSSLLNFYFQYLNPEIGEALAEVKKETVEKLMIKIASNNKPFINVVNYILLLKSKNENSTFFERLIDAMVYELYLPEQIKDAGCEVLKYLDNLPELNAEWSNEQKLKTIEKVYKELSSPKYPVNIAMAKMQEIEEVKIIEGKEEPSVLEAETKEFTSSEIEE